MTRGIMLGSENSEFQVIFFALYPKAITRNFTFTNGIMLGNENSELSFFFY